MSVNTQVYPYTYPTEASPTSAHRQWTGRDAPAPPPTRLQGASPAARPPRPSRPTAPSIPPPEPLHAPLVRAGPQPPDCPPATRLSHTRAVPTPSSSSSSHMPPRPSVPGAHGKSSSQIRPVMLEVVSEHAPWAFTGKGEKGKGKGKEEGQAEVRLGGRVEVDDDGGTRHHVCMQSCW